MKRSLATALLFLFSSLVSFSAMSEEKIVAVVSDVKGNAFYSMGGKTYPLSTGTHLPIQAEIFTEVGAQVSVNDYYDHIYHLAGGGHMVIHSNLIELKEGYLWVKSLKYDALRGAFRIHTANALVENTEGEGIVSFDAYTGKTQLLAVKGSFGFRNSRLEELGIILKEGQFSFIDLEHEEGHPRKPTPIGYASFKKVTSLFDGVEPFEKGAAAKQKTYLSHRPSNSNQFTTPERNVASVKTNSLFESALEKTRKKGDYKELKTLDQYPGPSVDDNKSTGKITVIKLRDPASEKVQQAGVMDYYKNKLKKLAQPKAQKKWRPSYQKKSNVTVRVFGEGSSQRRPASVKSSKPAMIRVKPGSKKVNTKKTSRKKSSSRTPASIGGMLPKVDTNAFESELLNQYKSQMRHDQEVNELIDQLESIDMDYKKDY